MLVEQIGMLRAERNSLVKIERTFQRRPRRQFRWGCWNFRSLDSCFVDKQTADVDAASYGA